MKSWHFVRAKNKGGFHFNLTRFMLSFWWRGYHYALVYGHLVMATPPHNVGEEVGQWNLLQGLS